MSRRDQIKLSEDEQGELLQSERVVGTLGIGVRGERTFTEAETEELLAAGRVLAAPLARENA